MTERVLESQREFAKNVVESVLAQMPGSDDEGAADDDQG